MARALVTGCSSGFGLLSAVELAVRGHDVVATVRNPDRVGDLLAACEAADVTVHVVPMDVDDATSVTAGVQAAVDLLGGLDVVVNNAGIEVRGPVELVSDDEVRQQFETNVFGLLRVVRASVPHLRGSDAGVVVNVSSIAGVISRPFAGIYAASKHAVEAISEALHFELGLSGIRVHVVQPGQFPTALGANTTTAAAFTPSAAGYWQLAEALEANVKGLAGGGAPPDPGLVARTIADLVEDPLAPLRTPVGSDAELVVAARHGHTFEEYEVLMRSALDHWEGYRRERQ
ncbi:MAG TPA: SDR family oxidoreductase [Acidimicrobiales bacterium]|nr:SDR family oxidoreductase [Acidimicrobiales bacterium]